MSDPKPGVDYTVEQIEPRSNGTTAPNGNDGASTNGKGGAAAPASYTPEPWPVLDNAALSVLAGEVVTCLKPHTESDPAALLLQYLSSFGNVAGRGPHYQIESDRHFANLFVLLAGDTAKARKGTSAGRIRAILELADPTWAVERMMGGMSSGEGVITAVRDPVWNMRKGVLEMVDPGVTDKTVAVVRA